MTALRFGSLVAFLFTLFLVPATARALDCNLNTVEDADDISSGTSLDCNDNGTPDECEKQPLTLARSDELFPLSRSPVAMATTDLNGDGVTDLAIGNKLGSRASNIAVLLSLGEREFEPLVEVPARDALSSITAADLDGDGDTDLLTANSDFLELFLNDGSGVFAPAEETIPITRFTRVAIARDVSGDGLPEIITANQNQNAVSVLINEGNLSFKAPFNVPAAGSEPTGLDTGDFDGDSNIDLVVSYRLNNKIGVFLNRGDGTFSRGPILDGTVRLAADVKTGDFNADGLSDFAVLYFDGLSAHLNLGNGQYETYYSEVFSNPQQKPLSLTVLDIDRDGFDDIVHIIEETGLVRVLLNFPQVSTFAESSASTTFFRSTTVAAGDFDDDGDRDLVVGSKLPDNYAFLWNGDDVAFGVRSSNISFTTRPHGAGTADVNGDGLLDVLMPTGDGNSVARLITQNDGSLPVFSNIPIPGASRIFEVAFGDFDLDGDVDLATGDWRASMIRVLLNDGDGNFPDQSAYRVGQNPFTIASGDLDGDGTVDLLSTNEIARDLSVIFNLGDGTFGRRLDLSPSADAEKAITVDHDGDGDLDIAVATNLRVAIFPNRGDGSFDAEQQFATPGASTYLVAGDLDSDGDQDIVVTLTNKRVAVYLNPGDGQYPQFGTAYEIGAVATSVIVADMDRDGFFDIVTSNESVNTTTVILGNSDGTFRNPFQFKTGRGPRFVVALDVDVDGDTDLVTANRAGVGATYLLSNLAETASDEDFLLTICTPLDFQKISRLENKSIVERTLKFVAPALDDPLLLGTVYQNVLVHALHQEFLETVFPERFPALSSAEYEALVSLRETRSYYAGTISRIRQGEDIVYGASIITDERDPAELLTQEEISRALDKLRETFTLEPLGYFPVTPLSEARARAFQNPGFEVYFDDALASQTFQAYTPAVGYGRVRILSAEDFETANTTGDISRQNILVLEIAPRDIEGVFAGVITAERQSELSHVFVRTARRQTPNAFVQGAMEAFAPYAGQLVRLEVTEGGYVVETATIEEAEEFWQSSQPVISVPPQIDGDFGDLASLDEILQAETANPGVPNEARFGGKASNLARLRQVLGEDPAFQQYQATGFGIPVRYFLEFMNSNTIPSALDPVQEVSYRQYLDELFAAPTFRSDSSIRFHALEEFRDFAEDNGIVNEQLVADLKARVAEIFPITTAEPMRVRFRSSSNVEDALEFNGAGLYESTAVCLADEDDGDDVGPSLCDARQNGERTISRALKRVWSSLYTFRAFEERSFFGIPEDLTAMAILCSRAFPDELANGVAFTGNVSNPADRRYVVTVQPGDASVVSPEPNVVAEKNVLVISDGQVTEIIRPLLGSSLVPPGTWVLSEDQISELGRLMAHVDQGFPLSLGEFSRSQVLLDMEFKIDSAGLLALKQVRPFLLTTPAPPTPTFELEIPPNTVLCGVYSPPRSPDVEYESKGQLHLRAGVFELPTVNSTILVDLVDSFVVGPDQELATAASQGKMQVTRNPAPSGIDTYRFEYTQLFELADGTTLDLRTNTTIDFEAEGDEPVELRRVLEEDFFFGPAGSEAMDARVDGISRIRLGLCRYDTLPFWKIDATLSDDTRILIEEHFSSDMRLDGAGSPESFNYAEVTLADGSSRSLSDYFDLVYASGRHNTSSIYRIILDPPLSIDGLNTPVYAIELFDERRLSDDVPSEHSAAYLDENFTEIARLEVTSFDRQTFTPIQTFRRGDTNADGSFNIADPLFVLEYLFRRGTAPSCHSAADTNDDGRLNLADAFDLIEHIFRAGGAPLPEPFAECGPDTTTDSLPCASFLGCRR